ncbi:UpxY family transcription antiterminator [Persicobacter sp. CCB-QB2]|uniref:UpxY family transcription antiterminator n=1 Tax=Persicobacter sp. CCB-QB2 TaxID=1561025 RepID=UPI0006A97ADC|nr:UpxY family transcription antiterminator [Persicobacter sp. CCB-QB2]
MLPFFYIALHNNNKKPMKAGWHVLYTQSRKEKVVAERLEEVGLEVFLPLHKVLRQWSDRKKWVEVPLFNSYVFVKLEDDQAYLKALNTKGASWFVQFQGDAARVSQQEIDIMRYMIGQEEQIQATEEAFAEGEKVLIQYGPFRDLTAEIVAIQGGRRVLLRIENLGQGLLLNMEQVALKKM